MSATSSTSRWHRSTLLRQDLRHAWRVVRKQPVFTATVVFTLALGIGLNTAVFSAVEAELLRPPPGVRDAEALLRVYRTAPGARWGSSSVAHYLDVREHTGDVFSGVAATAWRSMNITVGGLPRTVFAQVASANYFSLLGVTAARGRLFLPAEDTGWRANPVIVLSDGFWRDAFGADPSVIGTRIPVNGQQVTIVGVAPPRFRGLMPVVEPALWIPMTQLPQVWPSMAGEPTTWTVNFLDIVARLRPGISMAQAAARLDMLADEQRRADPTVYRDRGMAVIAAKDAGISPDIRSAELGLFGVVVVVVGLLLLLACGNVANLFLARATDRSREMATRIALGATRGTLVRQLLVESLLYAVIAAAVGLLLAAWAIAAVNRLTLPLNLTVRLDLALNVPVLAWTACLTLLTTVVFGLWPALHATRPSLVPALKGAPASGGTRSRARRAMIVAQAAVTVVLLSAAGFFLANLRHAAQVDKGFASDGLILAGLDPSLQGYTREETATFQRRLLERLRASPTVQSAALVAEVPLGVGSSDQSVEIPGYVPSPQESMTILYAAATPGYFATMGIPMRGRDFVDDDNASAQPVVVVNQHFVDRFWPGSDGVGKTVRIADRERVIVGVVPTGKYRRLGEAPTAFVWLPQEQQWRSSMSVVMRVRGGASQATALLRREVAALDANLPLGAPRTMDEHLAYALLPARLTAAALGAFGALGLLLASIGVYGVMAHAVAQRTREIGIRMALGASPRQLVRGMMREGLSLVTGGAVLGLVLAALAARALRSILSAGAGDALATCGAVTLVLVVVSAVATAIPARRAALVDPALAMRSE
ncbi:MAG: ABC transporter permease [Gemmatimonadetes bacterium]|nr:ABC transporter permease [Gemmatimonadota bacterium]